MMGRVQPVGLKEASLECGRALALPALGIVCVRDLHRCEASVSWGAGDAPEGAVLSPKSQAETVYQMISTEAALVLLREISLIESGQRKDEDRRWLLERCHCIRQFAFLPGLISPLLGSR